MEVKDETKSDLSQGTQISSSSSVSKLLALKAQRAPLEQKIIFADTTKEQEKTHGKLKHKQALSETLTREAVYQVALNVRDENNKDESLSQVVPKGLGRIMHSFLYAQKPLNDKVLSKYHVNISFCQTISIAQKADTSLLNTALKICHAVIEFCNTVFNVDHTWLSVLNTKGDHVYDFYLHTGCYPVSGHFSLASQ